MKTSNKFLLIFGIFLFTLANNLIAAPQKVEMADGLRQSGKIYVVVAVLLIIFLGIIWYLFKTEKQIKKLEDQWKKNANSGSNSTNIQKQVDASTGNNSK